MRSIASLGLLAIAIGASADVVRGEPLPRKGYFGVVTVADPKGIKVTRLVPGGTAEAAGLKVGDVLEFLNGNKLTDNGRFVALAHDLNGGAKFELRYSRDGSESTTAGLMVARPKASESNSDVIYDQVVSQGKRVRVIITRPKKGNGPFPTLFLIGGIGAYSVDAPFATMTYGKVIEPIADAGFVTVRIDKPGQGDSEGPAYKKLTFNAEADAYLQALRLTKSLPFVDANRVAIYGHSMGGCFAPVVASQESVKAVIANGTLFQSFTEYMLENTRRQSELSNMPADQLDQQQKQLSAAMYWIFDRNESPASVERNHSELAAFAKQTFPDGETYSGVGLPFFRDLEHTNLALAWSKTKANALIIYGENDFLSGRTDHERIVAFLNKLRPGSAEFKLLAKTDHLFTKTTSMRDSMDRWGKGGEFNPAIVEALLEYLTRKVA